MAQPTNTFSSYDAVGNKEDLSNVIYDISPTETPFMSTICGKGTAKSKLHEWQIDSLAAAAANAVIEGDEVSADSASATTRVSNYTQLSDKAVTVSSSQEAIDSAGRAKEMAYQMNKRSKELKRDMEFVLLSAQAPAAGNDTTARTLRPLSSWIATNASRGSGGSNGSSSAAVTDGTKRNFTQTLLDDLLSDMYEAGSNADYILCGSNHKKAIGDFTSIVTREDNKNLKKATRGIDVYASDLMDDLVVMPDRFIRKDSGAAREIYVLESDMLSVDYLQPFKSEELAKTGHSEKRMLSAEYTLCVKNEASCGVVADLN